jgi:hypothetical protein
MYECLLFFLFWQLIFNQKIQSGNTYNYVSDFVYTNFPYPSNLLEDLSKTLVRQCIFLCYVRN